MKNTIKLTSRLTSAKKTVAKKDGTALLVALRASQQLYAASFIKSKYKPILTSLAKKLNSQVELAIVRELGGGQIKAGRGAFYPDFAVTVDGTVQLREQKLVSTEQQGDKVIRKNKVSIAGGGGIVITKGKQEDLGTNFITLPSGDVGIEKELINTDKFVSDLIENAKNPAELIKVLSGRGKAATAVRTTLLAKASSIDIPVQFNGRLENRTITFSFADMKKAVLARKAGISVNVLDDSSIKLNFYFSGGTITNALNAMDKVIISELNGTLGKAVQNALREQVQLAGPGVAEEVAAFLKSLDLDYALKYIAGSAIISRGILKVNAINKSQKAEDSQKFISGAQWTALVQRRLGQSMAKIGNPTTPDLKERSGRFRSSISVMPNYRVNQLKYTYNPLYKSLEKYGYKPDMQVARTIREVAQAVYTRQFNIVKA